jgi:hypothetical protein
VKPRFPIFLLAAAGLGHAACGNSSAPGPDAGPACVTGLSADCKPLYDPPAYATIFSQILQPTCAQGVGTCHTGDAAKGGLIFQDADLAYSLLMGTVGGRARVIPGDPSCSLLLIRLESSDPTFRMPPGPTPLLESERCDIVQWIAQGAAR